MARRYSACSGLAGNSAVGTPASRITQEMKAADQGLVQSVPAKSRPTAAQYFATAFFAPAMGWIVHTLGWEYVFVSMGVLGLAALLSGKLPAKGRVGVILSGGNIDGPTMQQILTG